VGAWLEGAGERDAYVLADHYDKSGHRERAVEWYRRAAEDALAGHDFEGAIARADRAIAAGARESVLGALRVVQAEAHQWRGEIAATARAALEGANALARGSEPWFQAVDWLVTACVRQGDVEQALAWSDRVAMELRGCTASRSGTMAACRAALSMFIAGRYEEAALLLDVAEEAGRHPRVASDPAVAGQLCVGRAFRALHVEGDHAAHATWIAEAAASFERAGDLRRTCTHRGNHGFALLQLGRTSEAEDTLRVALHLATRLGLTDDAAVCEHNLGLALARRGAFDSARTIEQRACDVFAAQGDARLEGAARVYLAEIERLAGDLAAAESHARRGIEQLASSPPVRAAGLATLALVLVGRKAAREALAAAREALAVLESLGGLEEGEERVRLAVAEALRSAGDDAGARRAIADARARLLARADKLRDPASRSSFLEGVPENATTLERARAWLPSGR
jgi:tetratricopeptide (TPR) repeat protein